MSKKDFSWVNDVPKGTTHIFVDNENIERGLAKPTDNDFEKHCCGTIYDWDSISCAWSRHVHSSFALMHKRKPIQYFQEKYQDQLDTMRFLGECVNNVNQRKDSCKKDLLNKITFSNCTVTFENHTNSKVKVEVETVDGESYATISIGGDE